MVVVNDQFWQVVANELGFGSFNGVTIDALNLWAQSEGSTAANNPLAEETFYPGALSTPGWVGPSYDNWSDGAIATARFMKGSYYTQVVHQLGLGANLADIYAAINESPWCAGCQGGHYPEALYAVVSGQLAAPTTGSPTTITPGQPAGLSAAGEVWYEYMQKLQWWITTGSVETEQVMAQAIAIFNSI